MNDAEGTAMTEAQITGLREQLRDRRERLERALVEVPDAAEMVRLLEDVDAAIESLGGKAYGLCDVCGEDLDESQLLDNPLARYCLCRLSRSQLDALNEDLGLAWRIQLGLLPKQNLAFAGWETHYRYLPHGPMSGDYCDLVSAEKPERALYFLIGDVSGKGVAASLLMAHLNALFRTLIDQALPLNQIVERANNIFQKSTLSSHYATIVSGRARESGEIDICNAGHCPPLLVGGDRVVPVDSGNFPMGIFEDSPYRAHRLSLRPEDALVLYTDGLIDVRDAMGREYGMERLIACVGANRMQSPARMAEACIASADAFRSGVAHHDDLSVMVIRRT
jgi:sigma-B regulation protein RsbU (phosphoserine phosphatase)